MSQSVNMDVAATLKKGDVVYNNLIEFTREDGTTYPQTAKVAGPMRKDAYEGFVLPIRHTHGARGRISRCNYDLWRTTPQKELKPVRVARTRPVPAVVEEGEVTPTGRIRRSRDVHQELLNNAQEQLTTLVRSRRTRPAHG